MLSRGVLRGFLTRLDPNARRAALAWERRKTQTKRPFSLGKKAWRIGAPDRIRTYGLRRRRPTLHPRLRVGARRQICRGARCSRRRAVSDVCGISLLRRSRSKAQQLWTSRAEGVFPLFRCGPLPSGSTGRSGGRAQPPFQLPPIPLGLDPGDSHPWDSAYHGPHDCHRPSRQSGCGDPQILESEPTVGMVPEAGLLFTQASAEPSWHCGVHRGMASAGIYISLRIRSHLQRRSC